MGYIWDMIEYMVNYKCLGAVFRSFGVRNAYHMEYVAGVGKLSIYNNIGSHSHQSHPFGTNTI